MRTPGQDFLLAFGALMGIVSAAQAIEMHRAQLKGSKEHQDIVKRLAAIEAKLGRA